MSDETQSKKDMVHYLKKIKFILKHVQQYQEKNGKKNLRVLDVGCGVGNISLEIAKSGCDVTGIDSDQGSIEYANKRNTFPNCTFLVSNAHTLQIKHKFDIIICSEVLEHLTYPEKLIEFISNNLDKSGFLFLSIPNGYGPAELSGIPRKVAGKILKKMHIYEPVRDFKHKIIKDPVKKAQKNYGLDTLNTHGQGALHEQFFTQRALKKLLKQHNLKVDELQKSFVFIGTFPLYYIYARSRPLQKFDCKLADNLPPAVVSGWSFIVTFIDKK
ncbi:MAG: class I SAM-dependent methyltransferase [Candidatus Nanoarchaeia archaeon]